MVWRSAVRWIEQKATTASESSFRPQFLQYYSPSLRYRRPRARELASVSDSTPRWFRDQLWKIQQCLIAKNFSDALRMASHSTQDYKNLSFVHQMDFYRRTVVLMTSFHAFQPAVQLVNYLINQGIQPTSAMYVALLKNFEDHDPRYVEQILGILSKLGPEQHSDRSVEIMIAAMLHYKYPSGVILKIFEAYQDFRGPTWVVEPVLFGNLITVYTSMGRYEDAKELLSKYWLRPSLKITRDGTENFEIIPLLSIDRVKINGAIVAAVGNSENSFTDENPEMMFKRMFNRPWPSKEWRNGLGAATYPFTAFGRALQNSATLDLEKFDWILNRLSQASFYPHVHLCNILIDVYIRCGMGKKAITLYHEMMYSSLKQLSLPSPDTFHQLYTSFYNHPTITSRSFLQRTFRDMLTMHVFAIEKKLDAPYVCAKNLEAAFSFFLNAQDYPSVIVIIELMSRNLAWSTEQWSEITKKLRTILLSRISHEKESAETTWSERFLGSRTILFDSRVDGLRNVLSSKEPRSKGSALDVQVLEGIVYRALQAQLGHAARWPPESVDEKIRSKEILDDTDRIIASIKRKIIPDVWQNKGFSKKLTIISDQLRITPNSAKLLPFSSRSSSVRSQDCI